MISFDEALRIIMAEASPLGREVVPLGGAAGRVLAEPVIAAIDSPRADVSAMDGYAVRESDLAGLPAALRVVGESLPGVGWPDKIEAGTCVRIFTGAPMPDGADRVVIQEQVSSDGELACIAAQPSVGRWVRRRGGDFTKGVVVLPAGRVLDPAALIAASGADAAEVAVHRRPRIGIVTTGDELVEPGEARNAALAVPDSIGLGIAALAGAWGGETVTVTRLRDDLDAMIPVARDVVDVVDVVVVSGGASVGERDFAKAVFDPLGLELLFSKVAIRPGKPAWLGRVGETFIVGLPGNPTSALITAHLFLVPLLARLQGRTDDEALDWEPARLIAPLPSCDGRETFHRAVLRDGAVTPVEFQESHAQRVLAQSNCLVRQEANSAPIAAGEAVSVLRL